MLQNSPVATAVVAAAAAVAAATVAGRDDVRLQTCPEDPA